MNNFTKKDLQNGDMIVLRDGAKGVWVCNDNKVIVLNDGKYMRQDLVAEDLTSRSYDSYDIIRVYRGVECFNMCKGENNLVYDRAMIKESKSEEVTPDRYIRVAVVSSGYKLEEFINEAGYDNILQIMPTTNYNYTIIYKSEHAIDMEDC